jgi:predicted nucleotidyltransferase
MKISSDYRDLLSIFNAAGVRYLIVGGYAVMIHAEPRYTKDLNIWVDRSAANAQALFEALARFGAPLKGLMPTDFTEPEVFYQIGIEPVRIDILTSVSGLEFESTWERRLIVDFDGERVGVLAREDLLLSKRAAGRPRDRKHVRSVQKTRKSK